MSSPINPDADRPATSSEAAGVASSSLTLLLVRHGETPYNAEGRIQGHRDIPLSSQGRVQADLLARRLARIWQSEDTEDIFPVSRPDAVFTSDLSRAAQTAQILREGVPTLNTLPFLTTPLLRERSYGDWQGLTMEELRIARAAHPTGEDAPPNGETWPEVAIRMDQALAYIWERTPHNGATRTSVVVGHGGSLRLLFCRALQVGPDFAHGFRLGNTALSAVTFHAPPPETGKGRIVLVNDTAHLESRQR